VEYRREHRDILHALRQRDGEQARAALVQHLHHVRRSMFGY
jgi:DNA-binding GntR family transcriptional regulator